VPICFRIVAKPKGSKQTQHPKKELMGGGGKMGTNHILVRSN